MRRFGRQMSAGCSVRWPPSGCLRTGEWTALTARLRRLQVKKKKEKRKATKAPGLKLDFPAAVEQKVALTTFLFCLALSLSLLACRQACVTQVATRPGRISAQEDFLPSQLEHLHIAQFKGQSSEVKLETIQVIYSLLWCSMSCIFLWIFFTWFSATSSYFASLLLHSWWY